MKTVHTGEPPVTASANTADRTVLRDNREGVQRTAYLLSIDESRTAENQR